MAFYTRKTKDKASGKVRVEIVDSTTEEVVRWWYEMPIYHKEQVQVLKTNHPGGLHIRSTESTVEPLCDNPLNGNDKKNKITWVSGLEV